MLLSYALTLCNLAAKRVGANPLQASEPLLNEAIDMYCRAAGVAQMLTSLWATRWACSPGKERPVETSMTGLQLFAEFCLLEAQLLAAQKAGKRGMSSPTLVKLYRGALEKFAAIKYLVDGDKYLSSELSDTFLDYVHDGNIAIEGMMLKRFAEHCHSQDKNGLAVACMTKAYNILTVDSRRLESPIWSKIVGAAVHGTEIKSTLEGIVRINNNVTYDRVPNENDMLKQLPSATLIVQSKEFALPIAAEILSKKEKDSQDKIFTTPAEPSVADDANKTL